MDKLPSFLNPDSLLWERDADGNWRAVGFKPKDKPKPKAPLPVRGAIAILLTATVLSVTFGGLHNVFRWIMTGEVAETDTQ